MQGEGQEEPRPEERHYKSFQRARRNESMTLQSPSSGGNKIMGEKQREIQHLEHQIKLVSDDPDESDDISRGSRLTKFLSHRQYIWRCCVIKEDYHHRRL